MFTIRKTLADCLKYAMGNRNIITFQGADLLLIPGNKTEDKVIFGLQINCDPNNDGPEILILMQGQDTKNKMACTTGNFDERTLLMVMEKTLKTRYEQES